MKHSDYNSYSLYVIISLLMVLVISSLHSQTTPWHPVGNFSGKSIRSAVCDSSANIYININNVAIHRSSDNGSSWMRVGPTGRMAVAPNGNIFAAAGNQVFRSADHGKIWEEAIVDLANPVTDVISIAADPDGQIFLGTYDRGMFRSLDNGETWENIGEGLEQVSIWAIAFGPNGYMFAGTDSGVYRSSDQGLSWMRTGISELNSEVRALAFNAKGGLLAGTLGSGIVGSGIYRSIDNGQTWQITKRSPDMVYSLVAVDHRIFAGTVMQGIFYSTDDGELWQEYNEGIADGHVSFFSLVYSRQGFVFAGGGDGEGLYRCSVPVLAGATPPEMNLQTNDIVQRRGKLHYIMHRPGIVRISIYNNLGEKVKQVEDRWQDIGEHVISLEDLLLPAGVYHCIVESDAAVTRPLKILISPVR